MQDKDDILKASSFSFFVVVNLFTPYFDDYLPMLPRPGPVGGGGGGVTVTRVLSWLFNNNYYVLLIMIPSDRLRVSFRLLVSFFLSLVWAALFFIIVLQKLPD